MGKEGLLATEVTSRNYVYYLESSFAPSRFSPKTTQERLNIPNLSNINLNIFNHLEDHAGFTVGDAGHDETGAVAEGDVLSERQSLEMFRLPGSFRNSNFLHYFGKVLPR